MLRSALMTGLFLLTPAFVHAQVQKTPDIEVFGGLSYLNVAGYYERQHFFNAATGVTVNLNRHFGLFGDVSLPVVGPTERSSLIDFPLGIPTPVFTSRETTKTTTALFGPRFFLRREKMTLFAHGLAGVIRTSSKSEYTFGSQTGLAPSSSFVYHTNTFAYGFGGGMDLNVNRRFAIRLVQADYLRVTGNQLRLQSGVVVRLGKGSN